MINADLGTPLVVIIRKGPNRKRAAMTVGRLAEGDPQLRAELGKAGAISPLVRMLKHGNSEEREQAALAIGSAPS